VLTRQPELPARMIDQGLSAPVRTYRDISRRINHDSAVTGG